MEYRKLGKSDVKVSVVTMGTWAIGGWLWGGTDDDNAVAAIRKSIDLGVTSIDTAPIYGTGHSERVVGTAIAGRRDKVQLLTKFGVCWDHEGGEYKFVLKAEDGQSYKVFHNSHKDSILYECEQSLRRLGTDYIDLFQCHWRDKSTPLDETMEALDILVKAGKIRAGGVSNFTVEELEACRATFPLASVQPPYSMVRRDIENNVLPYCREHEIGVIVYSPLQLGLLTGAVSIDRTFTGDDLRAKSPYFKPVNRQRVLDFLGSIRPIADAHKATLAQLVVNWTIHQPGVTAALVGARNAQQATENAGSALSNLTADEMATINARLAELKLEL